VGVAVRSPFPANTTPQRLTRPPRSPRLSASSAFCAQRPERCNTVGEAETTLDPFKVSGPLVRLSRGGNVSAGQGESWYHKIPHICCESPRPHLGKPSPQIAMMAATYQHRHQSQPLYRQSTKRITHLKHTKAFFVPPQSYIYYDDHSGHHGCEEGKLGGRTLPRGRRRTVWQR